LVYHFATEILRGGGQASELPILNCKSQSNCFDYGSYGDYR